METANEKARKCCKPDKIVPLMHFALTFVWERVLFVFSDSNWDMVVTIARNESVSNRTESLIVYTLSKLAAAIIIVLLWKLVFSVLNKRIPKKIVKLFGLIFCLGLIVGVILYPSTFALDTDNYTNYSYALHFLPTYWQSIFTGALYGGCLMALPHPFSIFVFQWLGFICTVAFIYNGISKTGLPEKYEKFVLLLFVLPESFYIVFNAYRNNYYTILCMYYFSYLFFTSRKKDHCFTLNELVTVALLSAFIMVWRSEGILIGAGGVLYLYVCGGGVSSTLEKDLYSGAFFGSQLCGAEPFAGNWEPKILRPGLYADKHS